MADDEASWENNRENINPKMNSRDKVRVLTGIWVREQDGKWMFEQKSEASNKWIHLKLGLSYEELMSMVKERLELRAPNLTIKLSYQYPKWMEIDDGDGSTPQFISDDYEVEIFVQMRRKIEEVNMCVSISQCVNGININMQQPQGERTQVAASDGGGVGDEHGSGDDSDDAWNEFAMSNTPLTCPPYTKTGGPHTGQAEPNNIPYYRGGIKIRDGPYIIRLRIPTEGAGNRGKGIAAAEEVDVENDEDDCVVPVMAPITRGETSRTLHHQLFPPTVPNVQVPNEGKSSNSGEGEATLGALPPPLYNTWSGFKDALHEILNDKSSEPALFGRDAPPVIDSVNMDGFDGALDDVSYEGDRLFVGRIFKSKIDCKIKIAIHAINRKFHFCTQRSTPTFMVLVCVASKCPWRVYAAKVDGSRNFQIRQGMLKHCCIVDGRRNYHSLATTQVIGELMQSRFLGIKKLSTPTSIRKLLLDDYHVNISYWNVWRAREVEIERSLGSMAGSYALMPAYMGLLQSTNPGTICILEKTETDVGGMMFKYAFIAYSACIKGYPFMRKVIVIDETSLKGRFGGCILSACAQDANFQIFPLAFAVVNSENDASWEWFLEKLSSFVGDSDEVVFVSDHHGSIYNGLKKVYPKAHHAACTVHLWRNVHARFKSKRVASMMGVAARAFTISEFNKRFIEIQKIHPECASYLVDIGFTYWTRAHFEGERFNIMDSNVAESWKAVLKEACEFPLISMLEYIRTTIMSWFSIRCAKATKHKGNLTPKVRMLVEANLEASTCLVMRPISDMEFQVQSPDGACFMVNLLAGTCTCKEFQELRIPCKHAVAAARRANIPTDYMVASAYYVETWRRAFEVNIYPVPSVGGMEIGDSFNGELMPPAMMRTPSRPGDLCIMSRREYKRSGQRQCRRCTKCKGKAKTRLPVILPYKK